MASATPARAPDDGLRAKAIAFREDLLERHLSPEGLVIYRIDLRTIDDDLESGRYPPLADTPMFNGLLAAGACGHASAIRSSEREQALADASRALDGLELLMRVTGVPGLLARSVRRGPPPEPTQRKWFRGAPGYEAFSWRGDVSMDQYANGLLPAVALCSPWFPERTRALIRSTARGLLANRMHLVDPDGVSTRFGDLSWRSGLGLNSLAMLTGWGVFAWAAELDPDPRWAEQRDRLRDRYRVVARSRRTNLRVLDITNPSNDLMAWNLYRALIPLARRSGDPAYPDLRDGMERSWLRVRGDQNPYFGLSYCSLALVSCSDEIVESARAVLLAFPLEKRRLPTSPELDALPRRWLPGRKLEPRAREVVPIELRPVSSFEWKSSPYRVERTPVPDSKYSGLDFLMAFWLYEAVAADRGGVAP